MTKLLRTFIVLIFCAAQQPAAPAGGAQQMADMAQPMPANEPMPANDGAAEEGEAAMAEEDGAKMPAAEMPTAEMPGAEMP
ncbi:unnamed protein product, partial [Litomosoides sigmodontis]